MNYYANLILDELEGITDANELEYIIKQSLSFATNKEEIKEILIGTAIERELYEICAIINRL